MVPRQHGAGGAPGDPQQRRSARPGEAGLRNLHQDPERSRRSSPGAPSATSYGGAPDPYPAATRDRPPQEQTSSGMRHRGGDISSGGRGGGGSSNGSKARRRRTFPEFSNNDYLEEDSPPSGYYPHSAAAEATTEAAATATVTPARRRGLEAAGYRGNGDDRSPGAGQNHGIGEEGVDEYRVVRRRGWAPPEIGEPGERRYRRPAGQEGAGRRDQPRGEEVPAERRRSAGRRRALLDAEGGREGEEDNEHGHERLRHQTGRPPAPLPSRDDDAAAAEKEEEGVRDLFAVREGTRPGSAPSGSPGVRRGHGSLHHEGTRQQQQRLQRLPRRNSKQDTEPEGCTTGAAGSGPSERGKGVVGRPMEGRLGRCEDATAPSPLPPQSQRQPQPQPQAPAFVVHAEAVFRWAGLEGLTPEVLRRAKRGLREEEVVSKRAGERGNRNGSRGGVGAPLVVVSFWHAIGCGVWSPEGGPRDEVCLVLHVVCALSWSKRGFVFTRVRLHPNERWRDCHNAVVSCASF